MTLLYSDVEGSTQLLRRVRDAYGGILARYREIIRAAIAASEGIEQGTEGDSFLALFHSPGEACSAALSVQQQLGDEPWPDGQAIKARIGVHTGETVLGPSGWTGLAIHEAARIGSAAHGGQIVVSALTRTLVSGGGGVELAFTDLGQYRLKDLESPVRLYQLTHPSLEGGFPPLVSLDTQSGDVSAPLAEAHLEPRGSRIEAVIRLTKQRTTFGRSEEADVNLASDTTVSRLHACIEGYAGAFVLRDLSSTNGTYINGERLTGDRPLQPGDEVKIGSSLFVFQTATAATAALATSTGEPPPSLTRREREVLVELCRPLGDRSVAFPRPGTVAEIAGRLFIGQATVKFHLENLFDKFGLVEAGEGRRLALANDALRRGAVSMGELRQPSSDATS